MLYSVRSENIPAKEFYALLIEQTIISKLLGF